MDHVKTDLDEQVKFKIDTGHRLMQCQNTCIIRRERNCLESFTHLVTNFEGGKVRGTCTVQIEYRGKMYDLKLVVVKVGKNNSAVLGLPDIIKLKMIKAADSIKDLGTEKLIDANKALFEGIGKIKIHAVDIQLKSDYTPSITPCRKVPFMLINPLKEELEKMEKTGIIVKITEPTEFINPIVIVKKTNKGIRVYLDLQHLNQSILREHHQL